MSANPRLTMKRNVSRRGLVVLALFALFVVLLQPLCDTYHSHGGPQSGPAIAAVHSVGDDAPQHGHSGSCCAYMHDGMLAVPAAALTTTLESPAAAVPAAASLPAWRAASFSLAAPLPPDRVPVVKPYYARSTRILI